MRSEGSLKIKLGKYVVRLVKVLACHCYTCVGFGNRDPSQFTLSLTKGMLMNLNIFEVAKCFGGRGFAAICRAG